MENKNQKPKLSLDDIFNIKDEICDSIDSIKDDCTNCPFNKNNLCSLLDYILDYRDRIKTICTEWEEKRPTIADKINEILKPYGMKLMDGNHYIWFDNDNMKFHTSEFRTKDELINKLYKTKWEGKLK